MTFSVTRTVAKMSSTYFSATRSVVQKYKKSQFSVTRSVEETPVATIIKRVNS